MPKNLHKAIMLGAAWGIVEATLGHVLHLLPFSMGWFFWFPTAYFFIHSSYQWTKSIPSVMVSAAIAAFLKFIDLFFTTRIDIIINPAISIIIEAVSVMAVYHYVLKRDTKKLNILTIFLSSIIYRSLYIGYVTRLPQSFTDVASFTSTNSLLNFLYFNNIVNTFFIASGLYVAKKYSVQFNKVSDRLDRIMNHNRILKPALAATSVARAIVIQIFTK